MTISYHLDVSSASLFSFLRLLFRWKASVWKLVLKELIIWTILYLIVSFFYRTSYFMTPEQKVTFERVAHYCDNLLDYIPLTFVLGFFVNTIIVRWSDLLYNMGYVESQSIFVGNYIRGDDIETRLLRRTIVRYMCLTQALVFRDISVPVRRRFPTINCLIQAGLLLREEKEKLDAIKVEYDKYWAPTNWIYALIFRARKAGKITHDIMASKLCDEIKYFRYNLQMVCNYDWVPLPLVYPQTVFLATYAYFATCLIGRQKIITDRKVPYKHNTSLCIVDDEYDSAPEIRADKFWKRGRIEPLYSSISASEPVNPLIGSAINAKLDIKEGNEVMMKRLPERRNAIDLGRKRRANSRISINLGSLSRRRLSHRKISAMTVSAKEMQEIDARLPHLSPQDEDDNRKNGTHLTSCSICPNCHQLRNHSNPLNKVRERNMDEFIGRRQSLLPSMKLLPDDEVENDYNSAEMNAEKASTSTDSNFIPPDPSPTNINTNEQSSPNQKPKSNTKEGWF
ncbi:unnamed protein product [Anisakis simplex]|uniref:Bestrophin homolog n=1 Tax=Anisakis simplex TaxID=6269 RepID=A0A0M3JVZ4_ANISI|nr:unnamed protein product [Anisakis simplex]